MRSWQIQIQRTIHLKHAARPSKGQEININYEIKGSLDLKMRKEKKCFAHKIRVAIFHSRWT